MSCEFEEAERRSQLVAEELTLEVRKMRQNLDEQRKEHMREITMKEHQIKGKISKGFSLTFI